MHSCGLEDVILNRCLASTSQTLNMLVQIMFWSQGSSGGVKLRSGEYSLWFRSVICSDYMAHTTNTMLTFKHKRIAIKSCFFHYLCICMHIIYYISVNEARPTPDLLEANCAFAIRSGHQHSYFHKCVSQIVDQYVQMRI